MNFKTIGAGLLIAAMAATPALSVDYLIGDNDGHGVTACTIEMATDVTRFFDVADGDRYLMCVTPGDARAALERMKNKPKSGISHVVPAPVTPTPTPVTPDPDPEPVCHTVTNESGHWEWTTETRTRTINTPLGPIVIEIDVPVRNWVDTSTTEEVCE